MIVDVNFNSKTLVKKEDDGFHIYIGNYDLMNLAKNNISYEEIVFFLANGRFPSSLERSKILNDFCIGVVGGGKLALPSGRVSSNEAIKIFQSLVSVADWSSELFINIGTLFCIVAHILTDKLNIQCIQSDPHVGVVNWFAKTTGVCVDYPNNLEQLLMAWLNAGATPSAVSFVFHSGLGVSDQLSLCAAISAMSGAKHTSARINVLKTLLYFEEKFRYDISLEKSISNIFEYFQDQLNNEKLLYGFGHYFFKGPEPFIDPRIILVEEAIEKQNYDNNLLKILEICRAICSSGVLKKNDKYISLPINSDGYWAIFLYNEFKKITGNVNVALDVIPLLTVLTRSVGLLAEFHNTSVKTPKILG